MATSTSLQPPINEHVLGQTDLNLDAMDPDQSLLAASYDEDGPPGIVLTPAMARMMVELDVSVPVRGFRVRRLLTLEPGQLIETTWAHGDDMPLAAGEVALAWTEFEVIETQLAVRVTRLA